MLIICHSWLSDGMFMDGTIYAVLSRNLAIGTGAFWHPHFSNTLFPVFMEHPPLAFGLQGLFYMIFGDNRFVERFYSLLTVFVTAYIIVLIWRQISKKNTGGWLPLLFWVLMPTVSWASVNNMLENTLVIFLCLSVYFYLKSLAKNRILLVCISGLMLSLGFLTKGFVAFAPLSFPFFIWLFLRENKFWSMVTDTFLMLFSSIVPIAILFILPQSGEYLKTYIGMAFSKISEGETSDSRFYILRRLGMELLPSAGIIIVLMFFNWKGKRSFKNLKSGLLPGFAFFCLGLSGVLPILLTMDQSAYFLLTSFPFFAVSLALFLNPLVGNLISGVKENSKWPVFLKYFGIISLSASLILSVYFAGDINRNKNMILDMREITGQLKENSTVNILPEMKEDWSLYTYYERYKMVSLDPDLKNKHEFILINTALYSDTLEREFEKVNVNTTQYELFRRKTIPPEK